MKPRILINGLPGEELERLLYVVDGAMLHARARCAYAVA